MMLVETDDETRTVDAVWLGPKRMTMPFRARYVAWGVGAAIFAVLFAVERRAGINIGAWTVVFTLVAAAWVTRRICRHITYERPVRAVAIMFAHEVTAPRRAHRPVRMVLRPGKVRIR